MDKPVHTIVEEDLQTVARHRIGRDLTADEMPNAIHYFENGIQWWEVAECAVDLAVEEHPWHRRHGAVDSRRPFFYPLPAPPMVVSLETMHRATSLYGHYDGNSPNCLLPWAAGDQRPEMWQEPRAMSGFLQAQTRTSRP